MLKRTWCHWGSIITEYRRFSSEWAGSVPTLVWQSALWSNNAKKLLDKIKDWRGRREEETKERERGRERDQREGERDLKKKNLNGAHVTFYIEASVHEALCSLSPRRSPKGRRQTKSKLTTSCGDSAKRVSSLVTAYISLYFNICCRNERWWTRWHTLCFKLTKIASEVLRYRKQMFNSVRAGNLTNCALSSTLLVFTAWHSLYDRFTVCGYYCISRYCTAIQRGRAISQSLSERNSSL